MKIFIADYLPLRNKGEEEIVRGIEYLFKQKVIDDTIEFSIFDEVESIKTIGNIVVYPRVWVYPDFSRRIKSSKYLVFRSLLRSILFYLGINTLSRKIKGHQELFDDLRMADLVLIGHDGFYNQFSAALSFFLKKEGIRYAILGAGFAKPNVKVRFISDLLNRRCFDNAKYIILRERTSFKYVQEISKNSNVYLFHDPAFFCPPEGVETEKTKFLSTHLFTAEHMNIGITVCENSISFTGAFKNAENKIEEHRRFIVSLIERLSSKIDCEFFFIPHCIEKGLGDDLAIAYDIVKRLGSDNNNVHVISEDLPVLELKNIISRLDYLIGERTHSIINCISSQVPFTSLTCSGDFRTHDIVEHGCGLTSCVIDLDTPDLNDVEKKILEGIKKKEELKKELADINLALNEQVNSIIQII